MEKEKKRRVEPKKKESNERESRVDEMEFISDLHRQCLTRHECLVVSPS